jgi:peptidyl-prolyl cis-trans isomerase A (cyclophilin A)
MHLNLNGHLQIEYRIRPSSSDFYMARIKRPEAGRRRRPLSSSHLRLVRTMVILLSLVFVARLLRQADVFTHSTTAHHRNKKRQNKDQRRRRGANNAPDPNSLMAQQQQQQIMQQQNNNQFLRERPPESTTTTVEDHPAAAGRRIALDLEQLQGGRSGTLIIELMEEWAPIGVAHFQELLAADFYNDVRFFRVVPNFIAQFGISGDPTTQNIWKKVILQDDPVQHSNERGTITYAMSGPNTRTTQLFINLKDNTSLDRQGFAPFARIVAGLEWIDAIEDQYRELPNQGQIQQRGNEYLEENFPNLSFIAQARWIPQLE